MPATVARSTTEELFGSDREPANTWLGAQHVEGALPGVEVLAGGGLFQPQVVAGQRREHQPGRRRPGRAAVS